MSAPTRETPPVAAEANFVQTALELGGKSAEEAQKTGKIDEADEQVESLYAPQYQTSGSPVHRAVWDRHLPVELFSAREVPTDPDVETVMQASLETVRRHRDNGTLLDDQRKITTATLDDLGSVGYWGLLVDRQYGGSGTSFSQFARFLTRMATVDPTIAGLASVHGCIGAVDPLLGFGNDEQKERLLPILASGERVRTKMSLEDWPAKMTLEHVELFGGRSRCGW